MGSSSSDGMVIEACANGAELCEIIGELRKRKHEKEFITKIFEKRDKQLFPRDLLVAYVPTKRGGLRAAGLLKRSLKFDARRGSHICIDFVWVLSDFRRLGIGRRLLMDGLIAGRPKAVRLLVAGSDNNFRAVGLYESLGFRWVDRMMNDMMLEAEQPLMPSVPSFSSVIELGDLVAAAELAAEPAVARKGPEGPEVVP